MVRETAKRFTDLIVWQKAHKFVLSAYRFTSGFPKEEIYGLTSQLRRASVSIAANIVEGFKKTGAADKIRYLNISQGSLEECRYYLILTNDLGYGRTDILEEQIDEVAKLLAAYSNAISLLQMK
ncbi:MAG TPA: four helix bundle protein, partial [Phycisphaerales bacterium]|nr:four helix bundle protein [Phycisphaerales bacterium]